jgi:tryptophan halogenase
VNKAFLRKEGGVPIIGSNFGFHFENEKFVEFLEMYAERIGVEIIEDKVEQVDQNDHGIAALRMESGSVYSADLYIDCSGFRSLLLGGALDEPFESYDKTLYCNRALVGSWERGADEPIKPYTTCETMNAGWCWQIEHEKSVGRGYVYSPEFISDDEAEKEMREKNPKLGDTRIVNFRPGVRERTWVKNVVAIGNAAGFVEPLEATAMMTICDECRLLSVVLRECELQPTEGLKGLYNKQDHTNWEDVRTFLGMHYRFNTRIDNEFWRACRNDVDIGIAQEYVDFYKQNGPTLIGKSILPFRDAIFGLEGYLAMLLGQCVPHNVPHSVADTEARKVKQLRKENRHQANLGCSVEEGLATIRAPNWRWDPDFFPSVAAARK